MFCLNLGLKSVIFQAEFRAAPDVLPELRAKISHFPGGTPGGAWSFARSFSLDKPTPNKKGRPSRDGHELKNSINIS